MQDTCHSQVVNALQKAGWTVSDNVYLRVEETVVIIDLKAWQSDKGNFQQIIVVEVKCFLNESDDQDELYRAIGQYLMYRSMIAARGLNLPLYLSIPEPAYNRLFTRQMVQTVLQESRFKLLIVDVAHEEIVQWLD